jgi:hypothetical protein
MAGISYWTSVNIDRWRYGIAPVPAPVPGAVPVPVPVAGAVPVPLVPVPFEPLFMLLLWPMPLLLVELGTSAPFIVPAPPPVFVLVLPAPMPLLFVELGTLAPFIVPAPPPVFVVLLTPLLDPLKLPLVRDRLLPEVHPEPFDPL